MLPWLVAVAPFGLVIGVTAGQASIPSTIGWFTGPAIYGGSAQIAAIQLLDSGATAASVIATVLVINLRLVLYSAALARYWRGTPLWWRLLAGYLLIDPSFVVGIRHYENHRSAHAPARHGDQRPTVGELRSAHAFYLGAAVLLWVGWLIALGLGAVVGASVPEGLRLELLMPLYLVGQVVPSLRQRATRRAVVVSSVVAGACIAAPLNLGILVGITAGLAAGYLTSLKDRPDPTATPA
ncbi:AzlC family ABC transporter permease [Micromonospora maris]|uniref:AzlC family ABC transporter permease n=1 Tax=Micromonospora maris TaxID=1003110 RepID=UPI002E0DCA33|nr:AzlC family ABC transporter permease [Micromonospora maris]